MNNIVNGNFSDQQKVNRKHKNSWFLSTKKRDQETHRKVSRRRGQTKNVMTYRPCYDLARGTVWKSEAMLTKYASPVKAHFVTFVSLFRKGRFANLRWESDATLTKYTSLVEPRFVTLVFFRKARFSRVYLWRKSEATRTKYTSLVEVHFVTLVPFFRKGRFARVDLLWKSEAMLTKYASPVKAHWNPHHQTTDEKLFKYQLLLHQPVATRWQPLATRGNPWQGVATLAFMATTHGNPLQPLANRGNPLAIHGKPW